MIAIRQEAISRSFALILVCILGLCVTGCDRDPEAGDQPDEVTVRMKWFFAGTMAPWFLGQENGAFEGKGLDLTVRPGGPDNSSVKLVAAGSDTFGIAGADEVLLARAEGIPIVAIAVLFQDSPVGFASKKESGIDHPSEWQGKTVEVSYGSNAEVQYRALVEKFSVDEVREVPYSFNLVPFLEDKVDVTVVYLMDQVTTLRRKGVPINVMAARDYGVNPYGDVVITRQDTFDNNPGLVRRFVDATVESFRAAIREPEAAARALSAHVPDLDDEQVVLEVWQATIPFVAPQGKLEEVGSMSTERWFDTLRFVERYGDVRGSLSTDGAYVRVRED